MSDGSLLASPRSGAFRINHMVATCPECGRTRETKLMIDLSREGPEVERLVFVDPEGHLIAFPTRVEEDTSKTGESWIPKESDLVEIDGPYECPRCGGHASFDTPFLDRASGRVACPYCGATSRVPE